MNQDLVSIGTIFANNFFTIPDYQRGYAWELRQWDDLLQDLELLPVGKSHFTGTLILQTPQGENTTVKLEDGSAGTIRSVIDGQQRLTTIVLILKAIADEMERLDQPARLVQGIRETYLAAKDRNGQIQTRIKLNQDTQEFFYHSTLGYGLSVAGPQIRSQRLLDRAKHHIEGYLRDKKDQLGDTFTDWLDSLFEKITQNLKLIVYIVDDELDAGVIFETMNDRGKPLTELEKVKNYLLYLASKLDLPKDHDLGKRINATWKHIFESLMAAGISKVDDEDRLLRAHWLMAYDHDPKKWQQSRSIKERLNLKNYQGRHVDLLQDMDSYLETLREATTAFCDIYSPGHPGAFNQWENNTLRTNIVSWSKKLSRLGPRATFLPLLMAVRIKARDNGETYLRTVELCEKFDFRIYLWRRYRYNTAQTRFFRIANQFYNNPDSRWLDRELLKAHHTYCSNEKFIEHFDHGIDNWYAWSGLSYFLYEYEQHRAGGRDMKISWEDLEHRKKEKSIEHILPQSPSHPYWKQRFSKKDLEQWTHDIGNLTLTQDNPSLGNKSFLDKKGASGVKGTYADSSLFIERDLALNDDWTPDTIQARKEEIKAWAAKRWGIEPPPAEDVKPDGSIDAIFSRAAQFGVEEELLALNDLAVSFGLVPRAHTNSIAYVLPDNWTRSGITTTPRQNTIAVHFRPHNLGRLEGVSEVKLEEILEGEQWFLLSTEQVLEMVDRIQAVLDLNANNNEDDGVSKG